LNKTFKKSQAFSDRNWYAPLLALFAGLDAFIFLVPIEALLIPSILIKPKRWFSSALWVTLGSALGALALAYVISIHGENYVSTHFPKVFHSGSWDWSEKFMRKHGIWALAAIAASPLPQQAAVAFSAILKTPLVAIFLAVLLGRAAKYFFVCRLASLAPNLFRKKHAPQTQI